VISTEGATILAATFGDRYTFDVNSELMPGVQRQFPSFSAAAQEAGLSRIYAGVHTRVDHEAGVALGTAIARYEMGHALQAARR
jgi:hypothetical protein